METSGFTEEQMTVREAITKICANFADVIQSPFTYKWHRTELMGHWQEYWAAKDETGDYPHDLHNALAKDGWIGISLPEDLGGAGLGISEAAMMLHTISEYAKESQN